MPICETFDPDCYGCQQRAKEITVPDKAMPSRHFTSPRVPSAPTQLSKYDAPAYKRLRADGLQPRQVNGAYALEAQAKSAEDVERAVPRRTAYADRP